ncbi:hypothetical protein CROQUDRAFT_98076 [Cronartium quercuum f. sp. fusiforme G11]|uniref:Uncharacterized protein n=1 Tax=Cronartium quercuum f. sp. fusiforme G11 TaxID=708437 RepID=A0A9P6N8R3_9BASI|nr:hypothetical protein CROQUDRAFT_98076 [Cronartium quercuum f. sp. fusiforme G11]
MSSCFYLVANNQPEIRGLSFLLSACERRQAWPRFTARKVAVQGKEDADAATKAASELDDPQPPISFSLSSVGGNLGVPYPPSHYQKPSQ